MSDELTESETRGLRPALWATLGGAVLFWAVTLATFILVDADFFSGTDAERAAVIDAHRTAWRTTWALTMPAEILIGVGMIAVGRAFRRREKGVRSAAAGIVTVTGLLTVPTGIARFATSLSDGDYAANPGAWFDVLWAAQFVGVVVTLIVLAWLSWRNALPRWVSVAMVVFTAVAVLQLSPSTAYFPPLALFSAASLRRLHTSRSTNVVAPSLAQPRTRPASGPL